MRMDGAARRLTAGLIVAAAAMSASAAQAGAYADDLGKCLVRSADANDQILLVQWMFSALSLHPAVQPLTTITPAQRDVFDRRAADLMERLLVKDCHSETVNALKYEGALAMTMAFQVLGDVAGRGLMRDSRVTEAFEALGSYLDPAKMIEIGKAAGVAAPDLVNGDAE